MVADDLGAIIALARVCFGTGAWSGTTFASFVEPEASTLGDHGRARRWALVAQLPDQPCVGYVAMESVLDEAELQALAVHPLWRRRGVGTDLLRAALERAETGSAARVFLEVRASNRAARSLYQRHGFHEYGRRAGYYHDPDESAVLLRWSGRRPLTSELDESRP